MALFMKQDFSPPILSRRWIAIKFRPNMLINSHRHIISILESGLLFREDSVEVEQEAPSPEDVWKVAGGTKWGWLTRGETTVSFTLAGVVVALFPAKSMTRSSAIKLVGYLTVPGIVRAVHRSFCRGLLAELLVNMRDYLALARRAAACLKEYAALYSQLGSVTSVIESLHVLLCRQQSELSVLLSRASSALLGNAPWLRSDVAWEAVKFEDNDNLMKIHHAFLVVQSTLLKHIAMAHYVPSPYARKVYRNQNERIYWIHNVLIKHLNEEFKSNHESLDRMYRLLKNSSNRDIDTSKKLGSAINDRWLYSDVHTDVARSCLELKFVLNKCNSLDMFLDSCAMNNQELDLEILDKDIDEIVDKITNCLVTVQNSQIRLKKLRGKIDVTVKENGVDLVEESAPVLRIEDREPESKDEVFYFVKTEDDDVVQPAGDLITVPGKKEKDATKIVLSELKRKLGKREDVMRERERQALVKTMPELKDNVPEFPRQISLDDFVDRKGYITKLKRDKPKNRLFSSYKICSKRNKKLEYRLKMSAYKIESDICGVVYEANARFNVKSVLLTFSVVNKEIIIKRWYKIVENKNAVHNDVHDGPSISNEDKNINNDSFKVSKEDLDITSSSDSEYEDIIVAMRKNRVDKTNKYQNNRRTIDSGDENDRPIEYRLGTGLAMASVLQVNNRARMPNMVQEEVFIGDGEVSEDSGNEESA